MYVRKISRTGLFLTASIYERNWSEEMYSNVISPINKRRFLFRFKAKSWANSEICKNLLENYRLDIINE
jgi:hypothetical protein